MLRFGAKTGMVGGTVYYVNSLGVFKDSEQTSQLYASLKEKMCPYVNQAVDKLPFDIPSVPKTETFSQLGRHYWNAGVKAVFGFLVESPAYVTKWSRTAYDKMIEFTDAPPTTPAEPSSPDKPKA